jgi:hypothetical protein
MSREEISPSSQHPDWLWYPPKPLFNVYWGQSSQSMKLMSHFCLVLRLRIYGSIAILPYVLVLDYVQSFLISSDINSLAH